MKKPFCIVRGCTRDRYGRHARCKEHFNANQRDNYRKRVERLDEENRCPLCGHTPSQAAIRATMNLHCATCNVKPVQTRKPRTPKQREITIAYPCYADNTVQYLKAVVDHTEPMPESAGELRRLMERREKEGIVIALGLP